MPQRLNREDLNAFKARLKQQLGNAAIGISSYDQTYNSQIRIFTTERDLPAIREKLAGMGITQLSVDITSESGMRYRHGADAIVRFYYVPGETAATVRPPTVISSNIEHLKQAVLERANEFHNLYLQNYDKLPDVEKQAALMWVRNVEREIVSIEQYHAIESDATQALAGLLRNANTSLQHLRDDIAKARNRQEKLF